MFNTSALDAGVQDEVELVSLDRAHVLSAELRPNPRYAFAAIPWLEAWSRSYLPGQGWRGPVQAYAAFGAQRCLGFIALANQRLNGITVKSLGGYYWPYRTVPVNADEAERERFARAIAAHFTIYPPSTILRFGPVAARDEGVRALLATFHQENWIGLRKNAGSAFHLELPVKQADIAGMMSSSLYKNIQYLRRRLHRQGLEIAYERHRLHGRGHALLRDMQKIERASWVSGPGGHPKFVGQAEERFFTALTALSECGAQPVVWILRCGEEPIAFSFHIEAGDTIYIVANNYDDQWKSYSPGSLLTYEVLSDAPARGVLHVDWGRGDSGYKSRWGASASEALCDVLMFRPGVIGRAAWVLAKRALPDWSCADDFRSF